MSVHPQMALVTGVSSGIGAACAAKLASRGIAVVGMDVKAPSSPSASLPFAWRGEIDVSDTQAVAAYVADVEAERGAISILVNAAGIGGSGAAVLEMTDAELDRILNVNLRSAVLLCRAVLKGMVARGRGAIVNIASVAGLEGAPGHLPYGAAKAGLIHATRTLAWEYGRHGVRVNSVSPGLIRTPMTQGLFDMDDHLHQMIHWSALRRYGLPEEVASAVAFLASDEASFVTGHNLIIDGGWTSGRDQIPPRIG